MTPTPDAEYVIARTGGPMSSFYASLVVEFFVAMYAVLLVSLAVRRIAPVPSRRRSAR